MIERNKELLKSGVSPQLLQGVLQEHCKRLPGLTRCREYYDGKHKILSRDKADGDANNQLVINHAKYIVDLASAYLIGKPVEYSDEEQEEAVAMLADAYRRCNVDSVDAELARHAGIYGKGVELLFMDAEGKQRTAAIDPREAFVVYDDSVAHEPLFGVCIRGLTDETGERVKYEITVYTDKGKTKYKVDKLSDAPTVVENPESVKDACFFGGIPLIEYWNNEDEHGDFLSVISLIDAYNLLQSDRLNDKEQQVDALLVISNATLGKTDEEFRKNAKKVQTNRILEILSADKDFPAEAKYVTKQLSESGVQVLADAITADIHKIAMVPALTDEDFAGNASGVSLRYKLLGLEQLTKTKERWFREGLRSRMRLFARVLEIKKKKSLDAERVTMTFSRGLPVNDREQAQMVSWLQGIVPDDILLGQLSFIDDGPEAAKRMLEQRAAEAAGDGIAWGTRELPAAAPPEQAPTSEGA